MRKNCKKCKQEFETNRKNTICCSLACKKSQEAEQKAQWYHDHREQELEKDRLEYRNNREQKLEYQKTYSMKNSNKIRKYKKQYMYQRRQVDIIFKTITDLRTRMNIFLKTKQWQKQSRIKDIIGCTPEELQKHLDKTFFINYGRNYIAKDDIHVDHMIPLSLAKTIEEAEKLNHYSDLQYLLKADNLKKSNN